MFGSGVEDSKKGGDIDLIIVSDKLNFDDKYKIYSLITHTLEDEKIDIIIYNEKEKKYFAEESLKNSLRL